MMLTQYCVGCAGSALGMSLSQVWDIVIAGQVLVIFLGILGAALYLALRK
jgi:uncharacterized membrane protein YeaQ/YmgE (transglycosylase-associated protein family)